MLQGINIYSKILLPGTTLSWWQEKRNHCLIVNWYSCLHWVLSRPYRPTKFNFHSFDKAYSFFIYKCYFWSWIYLFQWSFHYRDDIKQSSYLFCKKEKNGLNFKINVHYSKESISHSRNFLLINYCQHFLLVIFIYLWMHTLSHSRQYLRQF